MIFTIWEDDDSDPNVQILIMIEGESLTTWPWYPPMRLLHRIEADTWEEACAQRNRLMGWEPYKPMDPPS